MAITAPLRRVAAALAGILITFSACACTGREPASDPSASQGTARGTVAVFTPDDGFTLARDMPLNTWHRLVDALKDRLVEQGFDADGIESRTDPDLESQSRSLQDYVVQLADARQDGDDTHDDAGTVTLVVAPAVASHEVTRYYGDYVTVDAGSPDAQDAQALQRMASTLGLAQDAGMRVILLGNGIDGVTPDATVSLATARDIGAMQARQLVSKLRLDATSRTNPKYVEILLPVAQDDEQSERFARDAFAGIWQVLGTYYRSGRVLSPSLTASAQTDEDDWQDMAFQATDEESVREELRRRLGTPQERYTHVPIDGVIAMNDFAASGVCAELTSLKYTGSAADINPSITIGDVVANMTGKTDLQRQPVPDPSRAPELPGDDEQAGTAVSQWPIVTGFGAYISNMPDIVDGKQWMTGLAAMQGNADAIASVCAAWRQGTALQDLDLADAAGNAIGLPLVAVSAGNLKTTLIDPGYVTLADAGL